MISSDKKINNPSVVEIVWCDANINSNKSQGYPDELQSNFGNKINLIMKEKVEDVLDHLNKSFSSKQKVEQKQTIIISSGKSIKKPY